MGTCRQTRRSPVRRALGSSSITNLVSPLLGCNLTGTGTSHALRAVSRPAHLPLFSLSLPLFLSCFFFLFFLFFFLKKKKNSSLSLFFFFPFFFLFFLKKKPTITLWDQATSPCTLVSTAHRSSTPSNVSIQGGHRSGL